ncbi:GIY-YIG nuclease family protein [Photobacterium chitinilyticum]|uniref:GIY-YIG nuclease family protein n=1 Tax=Photobacterium chitinilyticum TaxID=2485123 RepID=A0A444JMN5_9GAMM|nr:GIY-YIG nuclease family protein [Photobacterium chitinilyticum]RWX54341.1 GIY-YIG nuclease family protein [Photobacterium chitinilyticum]
MTKGRQLKIYLADGTVSGIRHAEIVNWTGQALAIPRVKIKDLDGWEEVHRPGVYFLFGYDDEVSRLAAYIGEAENITKRLQQHLSSKDFWNEAICFTNKDENLTKAHIKYLESRLIELSLHANRYQLDNGNQPPQSSLPRGERDAMEEFLENIRTLLGTLGHKLLEPVVKTTASEQTSSSEPNQDLVTLKGRKYKATAQLTSEGIVVLKGSEGSISANQSLSKGYTKIRDNLIDKGLLIEENSKLVATDDILFTSSSQAAAVLLGYPCNGLDYWIDNKGQSLKQRESLVDG